MEHRASMERLRGVPHRLRGFAVLFVAAVLAACVAAPAGSGEAAPSASALTASSGPGWRVVSEPGGGGAYTVGAALTDADAIALWDQMSLGGAPPRIDYAAEILAVFGPAVSGSCPEIRFDGVGFDLDGRLVFGRFTDQWELEFERGVRTPGPCTADANPHPFVVALDRDALPAMPFMLRLIETPEICPGCMQMPEVTVGEPAASPAPSASSAEAPATPVDPWGPLAVRAPEDGTDTARNEGTLRITETCVYLEARGALTLLSWPSDRTTWSPGPQTITFENFDGTTVTVRDGDQLALGGSGGHAGSGEPSDGSGEEWVGRLTWVVPPAASCSLEEWWSVGAVVPIETAGASAVPSPSLDPVTAEAVRIREMFGFRTDLPWIAEVARRSDTDSAYGTPLTPDELAELNQRAVDADPIIGPLQAYVADHPDEAGGIYIDHRQGGIVVSLWTGHLAEHEAAIRALIAPSEFVGFRQVRFSEVELRAIQQRAVDEVEWMLGIGARLMSAGVDTVENVADLTISSANPDAPRLIRERFGVDEEMLRVTSDGTGIELLERGTIKGRVLDAQGKPVPGIAIDARSPVTSTCGGETGHATDAAGRFVLEGCAPTTWTIRVFRNAENMLASVDVVLEPGDTAEVLIRLP